MVCIHSRVTHLFILLSVLCAPVLVAGAEGAGDSALSRFTAIYEMEWQQRQADRPGGGGAVPAHLPDVSRAAQERRLAEWRRVRDALSEIDPQALPEESRVDYRVYVAQIEELIASQEFREYEAPLTSFNGFWSGLAYLARRPLRTEADYRNYLSLLADFPTYFSQQQDNMRNGLRRGFTPAQVALQGRDLSIRRVADASDPEDVVFYDPFRTLPETFSAETAASLRAEARRVLADAVIPAYQSLLTFFLETYYPGARTTLAASDLPDGEAYYAWKLRQYTTLDLSADEIHQTGLREVASIREQMLEIKDDVGFVGSLDEFLEYLRTDPQFYASSEREYLKEAAWDAKQFDGVAADYFGRMPRTRFTIRPFPPEVARFSAGAGGGRTTYWLNTYKLDTRPLYSLMALTLHESAPGHSFQTSLAAENSARPAFRREVYMSVFGEGWALYCEKLGVEMGLYETPYDRFGMLSYQMWRAARLVIDTGIHAKGWSRDRAIRFLSDNTAIGEHEIETEVDRYITLPGQAVSFYTGMLAIEAARARAEKALGESFDIRHFHDTILSQGSVPLPVLQERIDRFIAEGGPSPYAGTTAP